MGTATCGFGRLQELATRGKTTGWRIINRFCRLSDVRWVPATDPDPDPAARGFRASGGGRLMACLTDAFWRRAPRPEPVRPTH